MWKLEELAAGFREAVFDAGRRRGRARLPHRGLRADQRARGHRRDGHRRAAALPRRASWRTAPPTWRSGGCRGRSTSAGWPRSRWSTFTHDRELPWLLPGVAPTGRQVEVLAISVVSVRHRSRAGRTTTLIASHRTLWDQVGLLDQLHRRMRRQPRARPPRGPGCAAGSRRRACAGRPRAPAPPRGRPPGLPGAPRAARCPTPTARRPARRRPRGRSGRPPRRARRPPARPARRSCAAGRGRSAAAGPAAAARGGSHGASASANRRASHSDSRPHTVATTTGAGAARSTRHAGWPRAPAAAPPRPRRTARAAGRRRRRPGTWPRAPARRPRRRRPGRRRRR